MPNDELPEAYVDKSAIWEYLRKHKVPTYLNFSDPAVFRAGRESMRADRKDGE